MNRKTALGLFSLLLWAVMLSVAVAAVRGGGRFELAGVLRILALVLGVILTAAGFAASKGHRLRLALTIAGTAAAGFGLNALELPPLARTLAIIALLALYLFVCAWSNSRPLRKALKPLNEAARAYRQDRDGEKFLAALDRCAPAFPENSVLKRADIGVITFREHIECERIEVLGRMGRLEERRALIDRLCRETRRPGLLAWLERLKAQEEGDAEEEGHAEEGRTEKERAEEEGAEGERAEPGPSEHR